MNKKVALVTGASKGIGKAISLKLAKEGVNVFLTGRSEKELSSISEGINKTYLKSSFASFDLEDDNTPSALIEKVIEEFGQLDIVINNAGYAVASSFEMTKPETWDKIMKINSKTPFFICQKALPYLKQSPAASIINISSVVGRLGYPEQAVYGASKHALMGWTKSLSKEMQKHHIRVHVISPGGVDTGMIDTMRPDIEKTDLIQPAEIAETIWFLVKNRGNFMVDEINIRRANGTPWQ